MGLLKLASAVSAYRGYEYFQNKKVLEVRKTGDGAYEGRVSGSEGREYHVAINLNHPRSSACECPHAAGRRIICKHMIALYFECFPQEAAAYYQEVIEEQEEYEQWQEHLEYAVCGCVRRMKKAQLQQELLQLLFDGPDWQYDRFVREHFDEGWLESLL